jgi:hypothetical protein
MSPLPTQADAQLARARRLLGDHKTRAKREGALDYALPEILELLTASPCCAYCGMPVASDVSLDHRTPTGRGGKHAQRKWYMRLAVSGAADDGARAAYEEVEERAKALQACYGAWRVEVLVSTGDTARPSFTPRPDEVRQREPPFELNGWTHPRALLQEARR